MKKLRRMNDIIICTLSAGAPARKLPQSKSGKKRWGRTICQGIQGPGGAGIARFENGR